MTDKAGRNDPCPCGSGKKYKQCCLLKKTSGAAKKIKAVWVNKPVQEVNLMERTFGQAVAENKHKTPSFLTPPPEKTATEDAQEGNANN